MQLLDGNFCSQQIRLEIAQEVATLVAQGNRPPHLAAVLVGNDGASENYVAFKVKDCAEVGVQSTLIRLPATVSEQELLEKIAELNADSAIDGFIVQLPLPRQIDENKVILAIDPHTVVDGFCPQSGFRNVGDVDFENVKDKCSYITYVTGGVGPMTRASLLQNTLKAHLRK